MDRNCNNQTNLQAVLQLTLSLAPALPTLAIVNTALSARHRINTHDG